MSKENPNSRKDRPNSEGLLLVSELRTILFFTLGSVAVIVGLSFFV